jgi:dTDP-4-dehydrorhamnose reductase
MKVFIAGCDGLLGQNLLRTSVGLGHEIAGSSRHPAPALPELLSGYHVLDAADPAAWDFVRREIRPDRIINAAAYTDVDGCERNPAECDRVNRDAVRWMAETGIPVVQISTDYVFDGVAGPYDEDAPVRPLNHYGRAKLESEAWALSSKEGLVLRTMWVWGRGKGAKKSFTEFVRETLAAGKSVRAVTDQIGNPTLAADLAGAVWALLASGRSGLYHAAGSDLVNRYEWARRVAEFYGLDQDGGASLIEPVESPAFKLDAARPLKSGLLCGKLERDTGFRLRGLEAQLQAL